MLSRTAMPLPMLWTNSSANYESRNYMLDTRVIRRPHLDSSTIE